MAEQITIPLDVLEGAFAVLLRHLRDVEGDTVTLGQEFFWAVPPRQLYDVTTEPSGHTIGQLSESLDELHGLVADPDAAVTFGLVWLADVLRAIGHTVVR